MVYDYHILIVDDHAFSCAHVSTILEKVGFQNYHTAESGTEALKQLRQNPIQLVILDVNMPDMDGVQFIKAMVREGFNPIVALMSSCSLKIMQSIALMANEVGISVIKIVPKPFETKHAQLLLKTLHQHSGHASVPKEKAVAHLQFDGNTLETALHTESIQAWFQPKVFLQTGKIEGAEALARWCHPEHDCLLPGSFLASIRHFKLDRLLLNRMLEDALNAHNHWKRMGFSIPISINLSASLLDDPDLPDELEQQVRDKDVPTGAISFELLEDEMTEMSNYYMGASRLRLKGFGLAQDDFGRGYSSLHNLLSLPFTDLKIDRSFVHKAAEDKDRATALKMAIDLGKELGLTVTAEGVESVKEIELLCQIKCDYAQGFFISTALEPHLFTQLLTSENSTYRLIRK